MAQIRSKYVVISPVKDESAHIESTFKSVIHQTVQPNCWVIVDDGSRDQTPAILSRYSKEHPWIQIVSAGTEANRGPGAPVIRAFCTGLSVVEHVDFDFIVKLDADLELPPNYFEELLRRFEADPSLGIASGVYLEYHRERWDVIPMPDYHAAGASKMIRTKCFKDIGGFVAHRGWDTIDEIRAQTLGWKTKHFDELQFLHLKPEGSGIGRVRTSLMQGEVYYLTGGGGLFFLLKIIQRMFRNRPWGLYGLAMLIGFLKPLVLRRPRLVTKAEHRFYRRLLNARIRRGVVRLFSTRRSVRHPWGYA